VRPSAQYIALSWLFFALGLGGASWASRIVTVHANLDIRHATLGLVLLTSAIGALIAFTSSTWLLDRVRQAHLTLTAAGIFYASLAAAGYCGSAVQLACVLFVMGASAGLINVSMNLYAVHREKRLKKTILARMHGFCSLGALVGAIAGQAAAASSYSLFTHLWVTAAAMALAADRDESAASTQAADADAKAAPATPTDSAKKSVALHRLGAAVACASICEGTLSSWTGVYLHHNLDLTEGSAARGYVVFTLAMVTARLGVEWLATQVGPRRVVLGGSGLMAVGVATLVVSPYAYLALGGVACCGVGLAAAVPLAYREASRRRPKATQRAMATMTQFTYVGALVGPPLVGFAAEALSLRVALGALVGLAVVIAWASRDLQA
jgi:MFS family permease